MQRVAPSEKDSHTVTLEKCLWDAADQCRADSGQDKWAWREHPFGFAPRARWVRLRRQQPKQYSAPVLSSNKLEFKKGEVLLGRIRPKFP